MKPKAMTGAERVAKRRQKLKEAGLVETRLYTTPAWKQRLKANEAQYRNDNCLDVAASKDEGEEL